MNAESEVVLSVSLLEAMHEALVCEAGLVNYVDHLKFWSPCRSSVGCREGVMYLVEWFL